jgi:hypothetical protein
MPYTIGIIVICRMLKENLITLFRFPYYIPKSKEGFYFGKILPLGNIKKSNVTHTKDFCETKLPKILNFEKKKLV